MARKSSIDEHPRNKKRNREAPSTESVTKKIPTSGCVCDQKLFEMRQDLSPSNPVEYSAMCFSAWKKDGIKPIIKCCVALFSFQICVSDQKNIIDLVRHIVASALNERLITTSIAQVSAEGLPRASVGADDCGLENYGCILEKALSKLISIVKYAEDSERERCMVGDANKKTGLTTLLYGAGSFSTFKDERDEIHQLLGIKPLPSTT